MHMPEMNHCQLWLWPPLLVGTQLGTAHWLGYKDKKKPNILALHQTGLNKQSGRREKRGKKVMFVDSKVAKELSAHMGGPLWASSQSRSLVLGSISSPGILGCWNTGGHAGRR